MTDQFRKSGIEGHANIPWGSHICHFYEKKKDLLELLASYFKAGLENNECCLWIIAPQFTQEECIAVLQQQIPDITQHLNQGHLEIHKYDEWYLDQGRFNPRKVIEEWNTKLEQAIAKGFEGLRVNGNEAWLRNKDWKD